MSTMNAAEPITSEDALPAHHHPTTSSSSSSLLIPITSSTNNNNYDPITQSGLILEIFPEEMNAVRPEQLSQVLRDESSPIQTWCAASLLYIQLKKEREGCELLNGAVDDTDGDVMMGSNTADKLRLLASAGISALALANRLIASGTREEELRTMADARFTKADNINQVYPPTWIGRGMLNLALGRVDQARFFFEQLTLRECGEILPALLGMAAVKFAEKDYAGAQTLYGRAIQKFKCGAAVRVGFGLASYKLGQIDRAKAAFQRAVDIDPENVEASLALAILEMASLDMTVQDGREYRSKAEKVMKMISTANMIDPSNGMVQNHLANHYFWKWSPVPGVNVSVERGSSVVKGSGIGNAVEAGDRVRIGDFETSIVGEEEGDIDEEIVKIKDAWKGASASGLKVWKKDYDRVLSLAKSAYSSTNISEIQAESLFMMARVHHARNDMEQANKFYDKACKHSPELSPARFGLAQTLIWDEAYEEAAAHLRLLLMTCPNATDALAALGLLEVKAGKDRREAFVYLKKAIDLDPFNADLVLIEALALQQHESDYTLSLDRYRKAVRLLEAQGRVVPAEVLTNMGVLCHETKKYDEALEMYGKALQALDENPDDSEHVDDGSEEILVQHSDNKLFWSYEKTGVRVKSHEGDEAKLLVVNSAQDLESLGIKAGADISIGSGTDITSTISEVVSGADGVVQLILKTSVSAHSEQEVLVKKSNGRLRNTSSISVAFNLARLHESSGRIVPAVELHKAIVKRHPSYVNSYLRLACIARDCGSLKDCSEWLKSAVAVAPGNPEVLTLVGNLHLSLCDWAPAQKVFDQLLTQKVPKVEAYSLLSLGNIYFNNLNAPKKYTKHLSHAAEYYKKILQKDNANAYAANGLGTVLAEKGELLKAKEVFNRVREVSGDTILDALLNLGHIYLAQKKHPEAVQMYQSYMTRTRSSGAPITSKNQDDDEAEVLLYISFAYFDWARQTELSNDVKAAPADERYKKCIDYIEMALKKGKTENVTLRYNWCMVKLQAANCVLQKVNRNIRRTAEEVKNALDGLEESLGIVQTMLQWKSEKKKVTVPTGMLTDFVSQCKHNIDSAKSHLNEELKKEKEAQVLRDFQRIETEANEKQRLLTATLEKEREAQEMEERERKAKQKMEQVNSLVDGWKQAAAAEKEKASAKKAKRSGNAPPGVDDEVGIFDTDVAPTNTAALFDESDDEDEVDNAAGDTNTEEPKKNEPVQNETEKDLFGDSSSDEEDIEMPKKRKKDDDDEEEDEQASSKKAKVDGEDTD